MHTIAQEACIKMKTMTIRNIPPSVTKGILETSEARHISMNAAVIALLAQGLGLDATQKKNDFSAFCGGWSAKEHDDFEQATQRTVDPEDWE